VEPPEPSQPTLRVAPTASRVAIAWCQRQGPANRTRRPRQRSSRITWDIEQVGDSCRLTVTHDQLREGASEQLFGGWPMILSGLKTWLETGELLTTPGSLMYAG
jgi:hypothetical protein